VQCEGISDHLPRLRHGMSDLKHSTGLQI